MADPGAGKTWSNADIIDGESEKTRSIRDILIPGIGKGRNNGDIPLPSARIV